MNAQGFMVRPVPKQHLPAPVRISTGFYLTEDELEKFAEALRTLVG